MALWTTASLTVTVESLVSLFLVARRPLSLALCGNNNIPRGFQPRERGSMDGPHGNPHPRQKKEPRGGGGFNSLHVGSSLVIVAFMIIAAERHEPADRFNPIQRVAIVTMLRYLIRQLYAEFHDEY